ncbi:MAG: hypothetical protein SGI83_14600 [Bacteroidota bacterium]|nr:hypothetical protein [Bacteroidota bacterium]
MDIKKLLHSFLLLLLVSLSAFSCKGAEPKAGAKGDTIILARSDSSFTIEAGKAYYQTAVVTTGEKIISGKKLLLLLDEPVIGQNPDGVYEVYICREQCTISILSSSSPGFVNLVDLYALAVNDPPKSLTIDITKKIAEWTKTGQALPSFFVTIVFRGNIMPGNVESVNTGKITVKGMRVVQEN